METNVEKLPKWAQDHIRRLERDLKSAQDDLSEIGGQEETNVHWGNWLQTRNLPKDSKVSFTLKSGATVDVYINGSQLKISGQHTIAIKPGASNVVYIEVDER